MSETKKTKCCICGKEITGYGNDPYPVKEEGLCCDLCNWTVVLKERKRLSDLNRKNNGTTGN